MIRYAFFLAVGVPATLLFSSLAVLGGLVGAPRSYYDCIHRTWSGVVLAAGGIRVEAEGLDRLDPGGPQVIVANHQSLLDILALFRALPVSLRFVAKMELSRVPVFGSAMRRAGHVFIDRSNRMQAVEVMRDAGERMKEEGLTLGLFPEGTRSRGRGLRRFRRGSFVLAIETRTTMVPVAVDGGARILPAGERRVHPGTLRVRCGDPVEMEGLDRDDRDRLLQAARASIDAMLEEMRGEREEVPAEEEGGGSSPRAGRRPG